MLEQPNTILTRRRVIGEFRRGDEPSAGQYANLEAYIEEKEGTVWEALKEKFQGISIERMITSVEPEKIVEIMALASDRDPEYKELGINLLAYFYLDYPYEAFSDEEEAKFVEILEEIAADVSKWASIERAYVQFKPAPPPFPPPGFIPPNDPRYSNQRYLNDGPEGVGATWAWDTTGGHGDNIKFVDIEEGWNLSHQDLPLGIPGPQAPGLNLRKFGHGTAVLGIVVATPNNNLGCAGIASAASAIVESDQEPGNVENIPDAIIRAIVQLNFGDVILIEDQYSASSSLMPVEIQSDIFDHIRTATAIGMIVVEPAGNSGVDFASYFGAFPSLNPSNPSSGAIMVGACTWGYDSSNPSSFLRHERIPATSRPTSHPLAPGPASNYGNRIDCFAWGEGVTTCGDGDSGTINNQYTDSFSGTSSASAIITGVALVIQSLAEERLHFRLGPLQMRDLVSSSAYGTPVYNPSDLTEIVEGYMPDLKKILDSYFGFGPLHEDIFIRDNLTDVGDSHTGPISNSPDINVRNSSTSINTYINDRNLSDSESIPTGGAGTTAFIYVRAFNRGEAPANNVKVSLYYSEPGTLITPVDWHPIVTNSTFGTIPAKASGTTGVNGVQVVEIPWNSIPADGHYCFIGLIGNPNDPLVDPTEPPIVEFYGDFDNFRKFIRENNNVTWKNFNVGLISSFMMMNFFVAGANDRARPMGLEIVAGLPEGAQVWLQGRDEFLFALQGKGSPNIEHDPEKGMARILVNPYGPYLFKDTIFPKDLHEPLQLIVRLPEGQHDKSYELFARQLYQGEEVGRVTWQLTPPDMIRVNGLTPGERRCIRLGWLLVGLLVLFAVVIGIHPFTSYLAEIIVGLGAVISGFVWHRTCNPSNETILKKIALGFGIGIVLLAAGMLAGLW